MPQTRIQQLDLYLWRLIGVPNKKKERLRVYDQLMALIDDKKMDLRDGGGTR